MSATCLSRRAFLTATATGAASVAFPNIITTAKGAANELVFVGFGEQAFLDCPILFRPATVVLFHVASHGTVRRALRTLALEPLGLLRSLPAATSGIADPVHSAPSSPDGAGLIAGRLPTTSSSSLAKSSGAVR